MNFVEILISGLILVICIIYIIYYIIQPFRTKKESHCHDCPYPNSCKNN